MTRLLWMCGALVFGSALAAIGCDAQKSDKDRADARGSPPPHGMKSAPSKGGLRERIDRTKVPEELHQLGLFYIQYVDERNRPPSNTEEFCNYFDRDAQQLSRAIKDKYYTVICKIASPRSGTVLAYEREADDQGKRWVVTGDAAVTRMDEGDFQKALVAK
jgi:hypothetical protein